MAYPGLGHLLLSKYLRGFFLFNWEVFLNYKAHINLGILYTFTGRFEMAKNALDITWVMLYAPTYLFAVWDSYRTTVDLNLQYILASREDAEVKTFNIDSVEINYLDKRTPWIALSWSALMPGLGQIYIHRIPSAFFSMGWFIVMAYLSKLLPALHYTLLGQFELAKSVVEAHWLLNIPCIYVWCMYEAYVNTVENNKLFDWEQSKFLKKNYQYKYFKMPFVR
ncbi:membrane protein [Desulfosporosinus sp. BG]|nr:membrane protein [Desulfosporosinus sp. BG]